MVQKPIKVFFLTHKFQKKWENELRFSMPQNRHQNYIHLLIFLIALLIQIKFKIVFVNSYQSFILE